MTKFPEHEKTFFLSGQAGQLDVLTTWPREAFPKSVAIICHPHPQQQGTMHNKVVTTLAKAFDLLGLAVVRFNFRGVGKSEGEYGATVGETEDLRTVLDWVKKTLPHCTVWLAGFSFGSFIAAKVANESNVEQLVTIATPVNHYDFVALTDIRCPWLSIIGDKDEIVPITEVRAFAENPPVPLKLIVLPNVGHFFHGHLIELRALLVQELSNGQPKEPDSN